MCVSMVRATRIQFITFKMHAVHFSLCQLIVFCFMLFSQSLFFCSSRLFLVDFRILSLVLSYEKKIQQQQNKSVRIWELYTDKWTSPMYSVHHRYEHFTHVEYILHSVDLIELMRLMCVCAYTLYCRWWWVLRPIDR